MKFIIGLLIWIIASVILCVPLLILTIFKWVITLFHTCRKRTVRIPETGELVEEELFALRANECFLPPDSSWIKGVVNVGLILKVGSGESKEALISVEKLRQRFQECFLREDIEGGKYDKLSSYLEKIGGYVYRVHRKYIDLNEHIYELTLKEEEGQSLEQLVSEWMLKEYGERKPCWEMGVVSMASREKVVVFKIHHGLADLYSILHILDKLCENQSPYLVRDFSEGKLAILKQLIEAPANLGKMKLPPADKSPCKVTLSSEKRNEWMMAFSTFPLEKLKEIRKKHDVRIASIMITIFIGAFKQFVEKDLGKEVPDQIAIGTTLGWPRHPSRFEGTPNRDKICNHWSGMLGKAPFGMSSEVELLTHVDKEIETFEKLGLPKFINLGMSHLMWPIPYLFDIMPKPEIGVIMSGITSLIGGDDYSLLGHPLQNIYSFANFHDSNPNMAGEFCSFSHSGKMEVSFGVHPSILRDQETLDRFANQYCHNELEALLKC